MTYLPTDIFKNILAYCDDRVERQQKNRHNSVVKHINHIGNDWYSNYIDCNDEFGNTTEERFEIMMEQTLDGDYASFKETAEMLYNDGDTDSKLMWSLTQLSLPAWYINKY